MWRASRRLVVDFFNCVGRCVHPNPDPRDLDDISDYEIEDVPVRSQQQAFRLSEFQPPPRQALVEQQQQCEPLQHRPDAPGTRRRSPPEVVIKVRQAIEEMMIIEHERAREQPPGDHLYHEALGALT